MEILEFIYKIHANYMRDGAFPHIIMLSSML